jgi:hypothetical protein
VVADDLVLSLSYFELGISFLSERCDSSSVVTDSESEIAPDLLNSTATVPEDAAAAVMDTLESFISFQKRDASLYLVTDRGKKNGFRVLRGATGGASRHALLSALAGSAGAR